MLHIAFVSPLKICADRHVFEFMHKFAAGFIVIFTFVAVNADGVNGSNVFIIAADAPVCNTGRSK